MREPPAPESERHRLASSAWQRQGLATVATSELLPLEIAESWQRSLLAAVNPELPAAPLLLDEDSLAARRQLEWLGVAEALLAPHVDAIRDSGHVLTLFAADGVMLASAGDPHTLDLLSEIHFTPGASWEEGLAGTNGPGTALALQRPVHVIGAEHYCAAWHPWHCAAVPLFEPRSRRLLGALDISGHQTQVTPYARGMAHALGRMVEQALALRAHAQRQRLIEQFSALVARYPRDTVVAVDAEGALVAAHPLSASALSLDQLRQKPDTSVITVRDAAWDIGVCLVRRAEPPASRPHASSAPASRPGAPAGSATARYRLSDLEGQHRMLEDARRLVRIASQNELPVLLLGESGVGKEVAAQAIHSEGGRAAGPFVAVNCGAIPRELVESELFGYAPGAFTGASRTGGRGKFEAARGGTLFLDEIAELPPSTQAVLLRVLAEGQYTPVGGTEPRSTEARIIAATNRDLPAEISAGQFRADLYYRLNVISVSLPPLRARSADIPSLCRRFLAAAARETGRSVTLDPAVMAVFMRYDWPGNVRELENLLRRLCAVSMDPVVHVTDLPREMRGAGPLAEPTPDASASSADNPHKARLVSVIAAARTMAEAAATLGVTRSTLYRQLERFGLRPSRGVRNA
jgi:sigma-54 dependent transcriptional regulator, acetoin dehydrogenase operon transcriptional activator AcoR